MVVAFIWHQLCVEVYVIAVALTTGTLSQPATHNSGRQNHPKKIIGTFLFRLQKNWTGINYRSSSFWVKLRQISTQKYF